jgi:DNA-directed RNA polymerase specialized sigma24 family protein
MKAYQPSDRSLLSRLRRSDRTVLDATYHKYANDLRLYLGEVESMEDCEDLINDAINTLWENREEMRGRLKIYLFGALLRAMEDDGRWQWGVPMWVVKSC